MDGEERARPARAPQPGDPRSDGPRPPAGWRDLAWTVFAVGLVAVTAVQLTRLAYVAATDPDVAPSAAGLFLAFVVTVVWLVTITWLTLGAWRRSVWGCPFDHTGDAPDGRRCPRHGVVAAPAGIDDPDSGR